MQFFRLRVWLVVLALVPQVLTAQKMRLEWAEEAQAKGEQKVEPIGQVDGRLYALVTRDLEGALEYSLLSYNDRLKEPLQKAIYIARTTPTSYYVNEAPTIYFDLEAKKIYFIGNSVNPTTKSVRGLLNVFNFSGQRIVKDKEIANYSYGGGNASLAISRVALSYDSSLIALYQAVPAKRNDPEKFVVNVFSKDFKELIWSRTVELPLVSKETYLKEVVIDKDGNFFLFYAVRGSRPSLASSAFGVNDIIGVNAFIYVVAPGGIQYEYKLNENDKQRLALGIGTDSTGSLLVSGFKDHTKFFTFRLNVESREPFELFETEIPDLYPSVSKKKYVLPYRLQECYFSSGDGNQLLLAEQFDEYISYSHVPGVGTYSVQHYIHGTAAVIKIAGSQEVEWVRRLPKLQHTTDDGGIYSSFYGFLHQGNVVLVYNDDPDNLAVVEDTLDNDLEESPRMKRAAIMAATVAPDGTLQKQLLQAYDPTLGVAIVPRLSQPINDTTHLVVARWGRAYRIGRLVVAD